MGRNVHPGHTGMLCPPLLQRTTVPTRPRPSARCCVSACSSWTGRWARSSRARLHETTSAGSASPTGRAISRATTPAVADPAGRDRGHPPGVSRRRGRPRHDEHLQRSTDLLADYGWPTRLRAERRGCRLARRGRRDHPSCPRFVLGALDRRTDRVDPAGRLRPGARTSRSPSSSRPISSRPADSSMAARTSCSSRRSSTPSTPGRRSSPSRYVDTVRAGRSSSARSPTPAGPCPTGDRGVLNSEDVRPRRRAELRPAPPRSGPISPSCAGRRHLRQLPPECGAPERVRRVRRDG